MRTGGGQPWTVRQGVAQDLHLMLYIRDALRIRLQGVTDEPPRLTVPPPEFTAENNLISSDSNRWLRWWREVTAIHAELALLSTESDSVSTRRSLYKKLQVAGEAPQFDGLRDTPALRDAAIQLLDHGALAWSNRLESDSDWTYDLGGLVSPDLIETVISNEQRAGRIGSAHPSLVLTVLQVQGRWWYSVSSRLLLLSFDAATNPDSCRHAIRTALRKKNELS